MQIPRFVCKKPCLTLPRVKAVVAGTLFSAAFALFGPPKVSLAQSFTYTGGGSGTVANPVTGLFSTGFTPTLTTGLTTADIIFGGSSYTATDDLPNTIFLYGLSFTNTGAVSLVRGSNVNAANSFTFSDPQISPNIAFNNTGLVTIGLDLIMTNSAGTTFITGSGSALLSGVLKSVGSLSKTGTGTLTLTGVGNSISGIGGTFSPVNSIGAAFGNGTTLITGADSTSYASLNISNGFSIAGFSGVAGTVTVSGTNGNGIASSLTTGTNASVYVGRAGGNGTLNVANGAALTTGSLLVGSNNGSNSGGVGTLNISGGSSVTIHTLSIGSSGCTGTVTVTGVGSDGVSSSLLINSTSTTGIIVGDSGSGTFNVTNGASVTNQGTFPNNRDLHIGYHSGGNGLMTVSGIGSNGAASSFTNAGNLTIATDTSSSGTLNVTDGGRFTNAGNLSIASGTSTSVVGTLNVTDGGRFTNAGTLSLGGGPSSVGRLNITNGGIFTNGGEVSGGIIIVSGISQSGVASSFQAPNIRTGQLFITNGATVTTGPSGTQSDGTLIINGGSLTTGFVSAFTGGAVIKLTNPLAGGYALTLTSPSFNLQFINSIITDAAAGDGASGSIAGGPGGAGGIRQTGNNQLFLNNANTYSGATQIDSGNIVMGNSFALQNSTAIINVDNGLSYGASLTTVTMGGLAGSGSFYSDIAVNVGNNNASTTYSGVMSGKGVLTKIGTGTLTLTGASNTTGTTTISQGTIAARSTALGTGAVTVGSNGRLSVGEAVNTSVAPQPVSTLTLSSLTLAAGGSQPQLTFNLGASGVSDLLILTNAGAAAFSASGPILVGFSSASGSALGFGTYNLITFSGQTTTANLPSITQYQAVAMGNLASLNAPANPFQYVTNGQGQQTLVFTTIGGAAIPEPPSLLLLLSTAPLPFGFAAASAAKSALRRLS